MASGISKGAVVPGGGISHVGGATRVTPRAPKPMTAAEEEARRKPATPALGAGNGTALPWDSAAEGKVAVAGAGYKNTAAQIAANRDIGLREFGLDPGYNDWKNNPYSQAAILQHNHEANESGINVTAGQALYSGQTGNAQGIEAGRRNRGFNELQNQEAQAKARWTGEEQAAEQKLKEEKQQAQEDAIKRALEAEQPDVPLGGTPNQQGGGVTKKVKKKGGGTTTIGIGGARKA